MISDQWSAQPPPHKTGRIIQDETGEVSDKWLVGPLPNRADQIIGGKTADHPMETNHE